MKLSLCMPTWNRAQMLDYTLGRIRDEYGDAVEVVIADNSSTDNTPDIVQSHAAKMAIRYIRHKEVRPYLGQLVALRNSTCPYIAFMADDDWVLPVIWEYVEQLESRPELMAVYSDQIAWDDESERELHRYFHLKSAVEFDSQPMALANFVCEALYYPELGVFRRKAFYKADCIISRGNLPNLLWMYRMSRQGVVRFEAADKAYYREHRIVKSRFQRTPTSNLLGRMGYIGDEYRNVLETLWLWALRDSGHPRCPEEMQLPIRRKIERFLHLRLPLEVGRAMQDGDFILAAELSRRLKLWHGHPDSDAVRTAAVAQHIATMKDLGADVQEYEVQEHYRV